MPGKTTPMTRRFVGRTVKSTADQTEPLPEINEEKHQKAEAGGQTSGLSPDVSGTEGVAREDERRTTEQLRLASDAVKQAADVIREVSDEQRQVLEQMRSTLQAYERLKLEFEQLKESLLGDEAPQPKE